LNKISEKNPDPQTTVFVVEGEFDMQSAPDLQRRVTESIGGGVERLVVDLSEVSFFDSSMLGVLIAAHRQFASQGRGALSVVCSEPSLCQIFDVTGLTDLLGVVDSREDAMSLANQRIEGTAAED
jgi:anti-sigma B factor antagonist